MFGHSMGNIFDRQNLVLILSVQWISFLLYKFWPFSLCQIVLFSLGVVLQSSALVDSKDKGKFAEVSHCELTDGFLLLFSFVKF